MARTAGSRFEEILPLFKGEDVGAMNWGFVRGKTQTIFPWGSKEGEPGASSLVPRRPASGRGAL